MRPFFCTSIVLLFSVPHTFSQQLSFLPLAQRTRCQYPAITAASNNFIYFTSPNESDFQFSIYTEWDRWYPNVLRSALQQAGFSLGLTKRYNHSKVGNCGWHDMVSITIGGWHRGTVTFKDISIATKTHRPVSGPQQSVPQRPPVVNITASHVSRQVGPLPLGHGHPLSFLLSYPRNAAFFLPRINRNLGFPRDILPRSFAQAQNSMAEPTTWHGTSRSPQHVPQKQTEDMIRTILLANSPEADIALFLMEIIGAVLSTVLLFCALVVLGRVLGRVLCPLRKPSDEEGNIQLEEIRSNWEGSDGTLTEQLKPEPVRVVPKGDDRFYTVRTKVEVPRSSSVYSKSVDGATLF